MGVIRRGHVNRVASVRVVADPATVEAVIEAHALRTDNPHAVTAQQAGAVPQLRAQAVVMSHVGVYRAFLYDAWHWHAPTLGKVLGRASLRG